MESGLILCGGTGAHTAVAFLRLHTLGYAFGFFDRGGKPFTLPTFYLVDQDSGDGRDDQPTAWQLARNLTKFHPGRFDWSHAIGRNQEPELIQCTPLPVGPSRDWYAKPYNTLENRFESSDFLPLLTAEPQRQIDYSKGMMGSPAVGSLLFRLKHHDERGKGLNHDEVFGEMLETRGRIVVAGSGVGGTGASVGPTVASSLAREAPGNVMAVMILNWFEFDDQADDDEIRERAQRRNQLMRENANSALEYYGQRLARSVATVPVGMPSGSLLKRRFTGDVGQPIRESYIHAVAALSAYRHYLRDQPYRAGLYAMGAVEPGRLDGTTEIPGGTLKGLANQAATLTSTLDVWIQVLSRPHAGRVRPAIYDAVAATGADVGQVADQLRQENEHYRQQLQWLDKALGIGGRVNPQFTREAHSRERLTVHRKPLQVPGEAAPDAVASALFHWTAQWIRDDVSKETQLEVTPGPPGGLQWPELRNVEGLGVSAEINGDLIRISDNNRDAVLEAFVDPEAVSANGWPHPLAAADFFRRAIRKRDRVAQRQLELMLVGHMTGRFRLEPVTDPGPEPPAVSLERLIVDARRDDEPHLAEYALMDTEGDRVVGFTSPHTLFAPVPFMNSDEDHRYWNRLWRDLSGADDGAAWNEAQTPTHWGDNDLAVRQICAWLAHQKQARQGNSPPWTRIFTEYPEHQDEVIPFGVGTLVRAYWGDPSDPDRKLVEINLPVPEVGEWTPPPGTPTLDETELFESIPGLRRLTDDAGQVLFEMVELEMPERRRKLRGWWKDHLERLHKDGEIHIFSRDEKGAVILGIMRKGTLHATRLADSILLDVNSLTIDTYTPLEQVPVPQSQTPKGSILRPDLPLKGDFIDLVQMQDGRSLLDHLKAGETVDRSQWGSEVESDAEGREKTFWRIPMRGRFNALPVTLRLPASVTPSKSHWMVWPNFRTRTGDRWKVYYVYSRNENIKLQTDLLWLENREGGQHLRHRMQSSEEEVAYPVAYDTSGEVPVHTGGPPLAFVMRSKRGGEQGLFLTPLQVISGDSPTALALAVDFGTSHSVAGVALGEGPASKVTLAADLTSQDPEGGLTHHVSEDWTHVGADAEGLGILASGSWWPTYSTTESTAFVPSELILPRLQLNSGQADRIVDWQPMKDYLIPRMDMTRDNLSEHVIADFKWDAASKLFSGREKQLREHYLALFLELVLGEVVAKQLRSLPNRPANLTFTYPLRSQEDDVKKYQESLRTVLQRCVRSTGVSLELKDDVGIYDESRAARLSGDNYGEVYVVGDLGGGTLDLFISAHGKPGIDFPEVADSAKLGGNRLLTMMAQASADYLPTDGNWNSGTASETEAKLRAWMRTVGAPRLFGLAAGNRPQLAELNVYGFQNASEADRARHLIDRYFRLVSEYMARNLVAYLVEHWYPRVPEADRERLRVSVQLRGNGWKLRYQEEDHEQATEAIQALVKARTLALWNVVTDNPYPAPEAGSHWPGAAAYRVEHPKVAPVLNVVDQAMAYQQVKNNWHTHTMVDLEVHHSNGDKVVVQWHSKVPFDTKGSEHLEVQGIEPPLVLSREAGSDTFKIDDLDATHRGNINRYLQKFGVMDPATGHYRAPTGPLVWEAVFDSDHFKPEG